MENIQQLTAAEAADILHQAADLYMASAKINFDYGTGEVHTATEVHMLKYIIEHPGKNVTQLAKDWDKSKPAISQMLKKLEASDLIFYKQSQESEKIQLYYATEKGLELNENHRQYDEKVFGPTLQALINNHDQEQVETAFQVLKSYIEIRRQKHYRSPKN